MYTLFQMDEYICVFISVYVYTKFGIKKKKVVEQDLLEVYLLCSPRNFSFTIRVIFRILVELFMLHAMASLVFISCQVPQRKAMNK